MKAVISECREYRYLLRRSLGSILRWYKPMLFIMLNPSIADDVQDDPTIRRVMSFAKREGATHLLVVNLFALRSTDPSELAKHHDPVGPENDKYVMEAIRECQSMPIVVAWGAHPLAKTRASEIRKMAGELYCLGKTKDGSPRHPLYVKSTQELILF